MTTVGWARCVDREGVVRAGNRLIQAGARLLNVSDDGQVFTLWFEHERADDPEWRAEVLAGVVDEECGAEAGQAEMPVRGEARGGEQDDVHVPGVSGDVHQELRGEARPDRHNDRCVRCGETATGELTATDGEGWTYHLACLRARLRERLRRRGFAPAWVEGVLR